MTVPKLRFKEFNGDWSSNKLKQLTDVLRCGVASTPTYVEEGGYPFLSAQNVSRDGLMDYSKVNNISAEFYKKISKTKLLKGDILYSRVGASYGVASIFDKDEEYGVYVSLTHIRANKDLDNVFLKLFLNSPKARVQAERGVFQGGGVQNLNVGVVEEFELSIPSKPEQTKIATFLSAVDEKINQLSQKLHLLGQYKQGMMQKLFSQQIRFRADDGSEFGEWEETELGKHCQIKTGKLDANAMRPNGEFRFYTCAKEFYLIDEYAFDTEALLISGNGANVGYIHYYKGKFNAYQRTYVLDQWQQNIIFIQYFLEQFLKERIYGEKKEGNTPYIVLSTLSEMPLLLPCLAEQTKIANFLSAIDQKIEVVAQQIEQAKTWKKGLLQQMFV